MSLTQDIRDTVAGFTNLFTVQDIVDALPGYNAKITAQIFYNLIWTEGIAEKTNLFNHVGIFRVVHNDESVRMNPRSAKSVTIDGKHYESIVAGARAKGLRPDGIKQAFLDASTKAGYPVTTVTHKGHVITRSHNY